MLNRISSKLLLRGLLAFAAVMSIQPINHAGADEPDRVVWEGQGWQVASMASERRFVGCYAMKDFFNVSGFGQRVRFVFANYRDDHWAALVGGSNPETVTNLRSEERRVGKEC